MAPPASESSARRPSGARRWFVAATTTASTAEANARPIDSCREWGLTELAALHYSADYIFVYKQYDLHMDHASVPVTLATQMMEAYPTLADAKTIKDPVFGVEIAAECPNVPSDILVPWNSWSDRKAFDETSRKLATLFIENFEQYADETDDAVKQAGPNV